MATGVFRYRPERYRSTLRPKIYSMPRSIAEFRLPSPASLDAFGRRRHYYFHDYDNQKIKIKALAGTFIKLAASTSASGGYIQSTANGASCHLSAANDTTWVAVSYTETWSVV